MGSGLVSESVSDRLCLFMRSWVPKKSAMTHFYRRKTGPPGSAGSSRLRVVLRAPRDLGNGADIGRHLVFKTTQVSSSLINQWNSPARRSMQHPGSAILFSTLDWKTLSSFSIPKKVNPRHSPVVKGIEKMSSRQMALRPLRVFGHIHTLTRVHSPGSAP
jgi:hypothetical protein